MRGQPDVPYVEFPEEQWSVLAGESTTLHPPCRIRTPDLQPFELITVRVSAGRGTLALPPESLDFLAGIRPSGNVLGNTNVASTAQEVTSGHIGLLDCGLPGFVRHGCNSRELSVFGDAMVPEQPLEQLYF